MWNAGLMAPHRVRALPLLPCHHIIHEPQVKAEVTTAQCCSEGHLAGKHLESPTDSGTGGALASFQNEGSRESGLGWKGRKTTGDKALSTGHRGQGASR